MSRPCSCRPPGRREHQRRPPCPGGCSALPRSHKAGTASVVQASGFRRDVTVFRLNAACAGDSGSEHAFRWNEAAHEYTIEAAHNPEVAGSNPAPATAEGPGNGAFLFMSLGLASVGERVLAPPVVGG
jgi:hypothetical protein